MEHLNALDRNSRYNNYCPVCGTILYRPEAPCPATSIPMHDQLEEGNITEEDPYRPPPRQVAYLNAYEMMEMLPRHWDFLLSLGIATPEHKHDFDQVLGIFIISLSGTFMDIAAIARTVWVPERILQSQNARASFYRWMRWVHVLFECVWLRLDYLHPSLQEDEQVAPFVEYHRSYAEIYPCAVLSSYEQLWQEILAEHGLVEAPPLVAIPGPPVPGSPPRRLRLMNPDPGMEGFDNVELEMNHEWEEVDDAMSDAWSDDGWGLAEDSDLQWDGCDG